MTQLLIPNEDAAGRLDVWLANRLQLSRTEAQRLIDQGLVTVDDQVAIKSMPIHPRMNVKVETVSTTATVDTGAPFEIRYEDDDVAVIYKPSDVVVHPGHGNETGTLVEALAIQMPLAAGSGPERPGIVHRLDKDTSGLLMIAKTDRAFEALSVAIRDREVTRIYLGLVMGVPRLPTGRIDAPIARSTKDRTRMSVTPQGRAAVTDFRVLEALGESSLVEATLDTGRTHQIRVHMQSIGHPVVGDSVYGKATMILAARFGLTRPFLHASSLRFTHPISSEPIDVEEPLPAELQTALAIARDG
ncbi:MAG: RluA family pseudouridine synthase [Actinomycetota bacterium]